MNKFIKTGLILLILSAALSAGARSYCADARQKDKYDTYEGRVSYLDWVTLKMRVNGVGVMEFYVPKEAKLSKLGKPIMFMDMNILDNVIITYYKDPSGRNVAIKIIVIVV